MDKTMRKKLASLLKQGEDSRFSRVGMALAQCLRFHIMESRRGLANIRNSIIVKKP